MNVVLVSLMGLPCCGKTSLCTDIIKQQYKFHNGPSKVVMFSYDDFVPLSVQSMYSISDSETQNATAEINLSLAKSLRSRYLKSVQFLVRSLRQNVAQVPAVVDSAEELNTFLNMDELNDQMQELNIFDGDGKSSCPAALSFTKSFTEKTLDLINTARGSNNIIILIDDNNYYHSMRNQIYQIAKAHKTGYCILYPISTVDDCLKRNKLRDKISQVPAEIIVAMSKKLEDPNPLRNTCDAFCLQITDVKDERIHVQIQATLEASLANPINIEVEDRTEEIEKERRICAENEIHQADQILRKWIHTQTITLKIGSKSGKESLREVSQRLLSKRNTILEGLKNGEIKVKSEISDYIGFQQEILHLANASDS